MVRRRLALRGGALLLSAVLAWQSWLQALPALSVGADLARVGYVAWAENARAAALERETISEEVFRARVADAVAAGDLLLLESYLAVGEAQDYTLAPEMVGAVAALQAQKRAPLARSLAALDGCIRGRSDSLDALGGQLACDLLVIGDIRDLTLQGWTWARGGEPDPIITGLAAAGLALDAGTVATGGGLAATNVGAAVIKIARRTGRLSGGLYADLVAMVRRGDTPALRAASGRLGDIAEATSPGTALRLLDQVDAPADLVRLADSARIGGKRTLAWTDAAGRRVLDVGTASLKTAAKLALQIGTLIISILMAMLSLAVGLFVHRLDPSRWLARRLSRPG